jgi:hypothetical protein
MSKIKGFAISGLTGHTGKVIFYSQFGNQLTRSMPSHYNDKNSITQQNTRFAKFMPATEMGRKMKSFSKFLFETQPKGKSATAMLIHQIAKCFGGTAVSPTVDLKLATVGNGSLRTVPWSTIEKDTTSTITGTWDDFHADYPNENADDDVMCVVTSPLQAYCVLVKTQAVRGDSQCTFPVPSNMVGAVVRVSGIMFVSKDLKYKSSFPLEASNGSVNLA